jgi:predicted nucleic-acid-binding Zn-ribbon protein
MIGKCPKCGSANLDRINVEMAFARGTAEPVYALERPTVCLNCGFFECQISEGPLAKLRRGAVKNLQKCGLVWFPTTKVNRGVG